MALESEKVSPSPPLSPGRLWAEQLAMGLALLVALLIFMAIFHPKLLTVGAEVLGPNYLSAYGWTSVVGILSQIVVHEAGTLAVAWWLRLPLHFRFFGFGAHATAILEPQRRRVIIDAVVGLAGPLTGTLFSFLLAGIYMLVNNPDTPQMLAPFFLGMACVGYFYNLSTLIPILDLEGGWIAPAIAPQAWLLGVVGMVLVLTYNFNLLLLCVASFSLPRLILLISARAPRLDLAGNTQQRTVINVGYFALVLLLAWFGSTTFERLPELVRDTMGD